MSTLQWAGPAARSSSKTQISHSHARRNMRVERRGGARRLRCWCLQKGRRRRCATNGAGSAHSDCTLGGYACVDMARLVASVAVRRGLRVVREIGSTSSALSWLMVLSTRVEIPREGEKGSGIPHSIATGIQTQYQWSRNKADFGGVLMRFHIRHNSKRSSKY